MDSEASHRSTVAVQENKAVLRPPHDQRSQCSHRSWPERAEPRFCTLPAQLHYTAASVVPFEIGDLHPCRLARPRAGVVEKEQEGVILTALAGFADSVT